MEGSFLEVPTSSWNPCRLCERLIKREEKIYIDDINRLEIYFTHVNTLTLGPMVSNLSALSDNKCREFLVLLVFIFIFVMFTKMILFFMTMVSGPAFAHLD